MSRVTKDTLGGRRIRRFRSSSSSSHSPIPFPCLAEGLEKCVCLWGYNAETKTEWYRFKLSSNDFKLRKKGKRKMIGKKLIQKRRRQIHHHHGDNELGMGILYPILSRQGIFRNCSAALGPVVYCAGIDKRRGRKVRCFDVSRPEDGWKKVARMHEKRRDPNAVVLDGKLYVMGGTLACGEKSFWNDERYILDGSKCCNSENWAEVFDPCLQSWEILPPPIQSIPALLSNEIIIAPIDATKTILLGFPNSDVVYLYDPNAKYWEVSYHNLSIYSSNFFYKRPAVVGHTLYWLTYSFQVCAYDMESRNWRFGSVEALKEERRMQKYSDIDCVPRLLHLGAQDFCIFWSSPQDQADYRSPQDQVMRSHCLKVRVSECTDPSLLGVVAMSCQSYVIDHFVFFADGLLLDSIE